MKAYGYCRVSSMEQLNGTSLQEQQREIERYCQQNEITLARVFVDKAISGGKALSDRPEGSKLVEAVANGEAQAVVITRLDRGFRSVVDCIVNVEAWERNNVELHVLNMGGMSVNTASPLGRFFLSTMAAIAELEKGLIAERCAQGRAARKAQNGRLGEVPYGYSLAPDGRSLLRCQEEQETIDLALGLKGEGYSAAAIARELNRRGIPTKKGSSAWSHTQILRLINRAA